VSKTRQAQKPNSYREPAAETVGDLAVNKLADCIHQQQQREDYSDLRLVPQEGVAYLFADHRHVLAAKIERKVCDPGGRKDSDLPAFEVIGIQSTLIA
jgi:hypothetical protein